MTAVPAATAVMTPPMLTVATDAADVAKVDAEVRFAVVASLYVPVTVSACVPPTESDGVAGASAIVESVGPGTVMVAVAVLPDDVCVAVTVEVPTARAVTSPVDDTVAIAGADETNVEPVVRLLVVASLYVPVTTRACVAPTAVVAVRGLTAIDDSVTGVGATVSLLLLQETNSSAAHAVSSADASPTLGLLMMSSRGAAVAAAAGIVRRSWQSNLVRRSNKVYGGLCPGRNRLATRQSGRIRAPRRSACL